MKFEKNLIVLVVLALAEFSSAKVPSVVKICSRNDPNLDDCIKNSIVNLKPYLGDGDLGDGFRVPALEPFLYDGFSINPAPNFLVKVNNASLTGSTNFTVEKLRFNFNKLNTDMITFFPELRMVGTYDMRAKVSILDITGKGDLKAVISNTKMRVKVNGERFEKDGQTFIKFTKFTIRIQVGKAKVHLSNLFNGDPTLQAVGNQLVNENQELFFEFILPVMEEQFGKLFKDVGNAIVEQATIDELFPEQMPA